MWPRWGMGGRCGRRRYTLSNAEFLPWANLLIAVIERARLDAAGEVRDIRRPAQRPPVIAEARAWLWTVQPRWCERHHVPRPAVVQPTLLAGMD
jgi:hypothetical protein